MTEADSMQVFGAIIADRHSYRTLIDVAARGAMALAKADRPPDPPGAGMSPAAFETKFLRLLELDSTIVTLWRRYQAGELDREEFTAELHSQVLELERWEWRD